MTKREPSAVHLIAHDPDDLVVISALLQDALVRHGDQVDYLGGIYALQSQLGLFVHPAGKTALSLQGKAHYLELSSKKAQLFGGNDIQTVCQCVCLLLQVSGKYICIPLRG